MVLETAQLCEFMERYSLSESLSNTDFRKSIKKLHKRYLALLTFWAELQHQHATKPASIGHLSFGLSSAQSVYIQEAISDHGGSIFCWFNGAYKLAEMSSRSAIETVIRGAASVENLSILTERRVYEVFDLAKATQLFSDNNGQDILNALQQRYGQLCQSTHSATEGHMAKISCLSHFPHFENRRSQVCADILADVMTKTLVLLTRLMPNIVVESHHRNREILDAVLPKEIRLWLAGAE